MSHDFLTLEDVLTIHDKQIALFGGERGVRDIGLLESAIATPKATFQGQLLHDGVLAIASAYLYHIVQNHPFMDGNKRAGAVVAIVFLEMNGVELNLSNEELVELVLKVATGKMLKPEIEAILRIHVLAT